MPEVGSTIGVLLCGHGTRDVSGALEFLSLAEQVKQRLPEFSVTPAFMELAEPSFEAGLDRLRDAGCKTILVSPAMLFAAGHLKTDLPDMLAQYAGRHPGLDLHLGRAFGVDAAMARAAADRIRQAEPGSGAVMPEDTGLLMVARGSSDPDANADAMKMMRLLWEGLGLGWAEIGYCDVTFPHVEPALDRLARQGHQRIVVLPYLLFNGVLIGRLRGWVDAAAARYPEVAFAVAPYLNDHPEIVSLYADRARQTLAEASAADCCLCKYRHPMPGFEAEVAAASTLGFGPKQKRPYPYAGHQFGPRQPKKTTEQGKANQNN